MEKSAEYLGAYAVLAEMKNEFHITLPMETAYLLMGQIRLLESKVCRLESEAYERKAKDWQQKPVPRNVPPSGELTKVAR